MMFDIIPDSLNNCFHRMIKSPTLSLEQMKFEWFRIASFSTFPFDSPVSATRLAEAGFYYNGEDDEVACFRCGLKHKGWRKMDVPIEVHKVLSPSCSFITDRGAGNVSIKQSPLDFVTSTCEVPNNRSQRNENNAPASTNAHFGSSLHVNNQTMPPLEYGENKNVAGAYGGHDDILPASNPAKISDRQHESVFVVHGGMNKIESSPPNLRGGSACQQTQASNSGRLNESPIERNRSTDGDVIRTVKQSANKTVIMEPLGISFDKPVHSQYAVVTTRLSSFDSWPKQLTQSPQELSKAGFFYEGTSDKVRCFFCGGGLFNWDPQDDPWVEHARWFPKCVYLRQSKGDDFVTRVQIDKERQENMAISNQNMLHSSNQHKDMMSMSHPAAVSVLTMGCKPSLVKNALQDLAREREQETLTAERLLVKIWELEERETKEGIPSSFPGDDQLHEMGDQADRMKHKDSKSPSVEVQQNRSSDLDDAERKAIVEENRQLKELQTCKICLDEEVSIVFLPCGHMSACASCAPALRKCPICRTFIKGTVKAIIS